MGIAVVLACAACRTGATTHAPVAIARPQPTPVPKPVPVPVPLGIESDLDDVQMVSPTVGWALANGDPYRTEDGGATFHRTKTSPASRTDSQRPAGPELHVGSERVAWVVDPLDNGAAFHRTTDAGKTWATTRLIAPGGGGAIGGVSASFSGEKLGWAVVTPSWDTEIPSQIVYRTTDGGRTFTSMGKVKTIERVSARSDQIAYAPPDRSMSGESNLLFRTTNGGRTWDTILVPSVSRQDVGRAGPITFFGPDRTFAAMLTTSMHNTIVLYRSSDGGASWRIDATLESETMCARTVDDRAAFVAVRGSPPILHRSFRHGIWDEIGALPASDCERRLQSFDGTTLFLNPSPGHRGMWRSSDAGRHWEEVGRYSYEDD